MNDSENRAEQYVRQLSLQGTSYRYQWLMFLDWFGTLEGGVRLPATPEVVAKYLRLRATAGARPSTLKVICSAIARQHTAQNLPNPCESEVVLAILSDLKREAPPAAPRSRPLDLECYRAIRETARRPRKSRDGRLQPAWRAQQRGARDVAMIALMRDGRLRVRDASALTWSAVERLDNGIGRLWLGEGQDAETRVLSADTMSLLDEIRGDAGDDDRIIGLKPNQITLRIRAAAEHAGLGPGYSGESPRLGMLKDLEDLGPVLLGRYLEDEARELPPGHLRSEAID